MVYEQGRGGQSDLPDMERAVAVGRELLDLLQNLDHAEARSLDVMHTRVGGSKSTVHHRLSRLVEASLVKHTERVGYSLTEAGLAELDGSKGEAVPWPQLPLPTQTRELPVLHQAVIELALCAAAGRYHGVFDDALATFALFGRGLRLKTLVMRFACTLAGADHRRQVLRLFKESAGTTSIRRNHQGSAKVRGAAGAPIVGLDEFARANADVKQACLIYVFGESEFPEPDGSFLQVKATPILALNPPEELMAIDLKDVDLQKLTGFDSAMRRRMVLVNFSNVEIPAALQGTGGKRLLESMMKAGPFTLPRPVFPDHLPDELVRDALLALFEQPERIGETDVQMIAQLVAGATAYLEKEGASRNVLRNVALCYETLGWLKADWRPALAACLGAPPEGEEEIPAQPSVASSDEADMGSNEEDMHGLREVHAYARSRGLPWAVVMKRISLPEQLAAAGIGLEQAVRSQVRLNELGLADPQRLEALVQNVREVERLELEDGQRLEDLVQNGREVERLGLEAGDLTRIGQALALDVDPHMSVEDAYVHLLRLLREHASIEEGIDDARARHARDLVAQGQELAELRSAVLGQRKLMEDYAAMLDGLREAIARAKAAPNAGAIVKELDALREGRYFARLEAHLERQREHSSA
jgi:hypothetical protein